MSDEKNGPRMLRMVRWRGVCQDADRLRAPRVQDRFDALARIIHMGDPHTAKQALAFWYREEQQRLDGDPRATREDWRVLWMLYLEMKSKIGGRLTVMDTELGYYSQNVAPDYGKVTHTYEAWATPVKLRRLFNEGNELIIQGHVGTGKSHLAVLFMEAVLGLGKAGFHVISNVSGIQDPTGKYSDRIHYVSRLSEILRIWTALPPDTPILLVLDEPESNLRGGNSKGKTVYLDFRYMIRKLGMAKVEIWHTESEQYKQIREEKSDHLYRILKDARDAFQFTQTVRGQKIAQRVEQVPGLQVLSYATKGMASIRPDVDMEELIDRIAKLYDQQAMKDSVREALEDPRYYLNPERMGEAVEEAARENQRRREKAEDEAFIQRILAAPKDFMTSRDGFDRDLVSRVLGVGFARARLLAVEAWKRHQQRGEDLTAEDARVVEEVLARSLEFLNQSGRGFSREKIRVAYGLSMPRAMRIAREAWRRRKAP
jgi:hypothetical protein